MPDNQGMQSTKIVVMVKRGLVDAVYCTDESAEVFLVDYDNLDNAGNLEADEQKIIAEGENAIKEFKMKPVF